MVNYKRYSKYITRSVNHIFKTFLNDSSIEEVFITQSSEKDPSISVEIEGTLCGEIVINMPEATLDKITKVFVPGSGKKKMEAYYRDVAGELANMISGTFANQLQYMDHNIRLSAPEFNDDPITVKAFYDNVNLSFSSNYGGFDIDLYYRENE